MNAPPKPWTRTTTRRPCPVCRGSGCLASSATDPASIVCARVSSAEPIGNRGWLHELRPAPTWTAWRMSLERLKKGT